jgi:hypothetical protein
MKYIKKFNESIEHQIYNQVLDTIKHCFLEFEDNGWYWITNYMNPDSISVYNPPNFNCRMIMKEDEYIHSGLRHVYIDWTGEIDSDGNITWYSKELSDDDGFGDIKDEKIKEEAEDFLVAVKRIQADIGLGFNFSYNNKGGEKRIIIQGSI